MVERGIYGQMWGGRGRRGGAGQMWRDIAIATLRRLFIFHPANYFCWHGYCLLVKLSYFPPLKPWDQ
jgi:hypothetical protein